MSTEPQYCDKCDDLTKTIDDITAAIEALAADELKEELRFVMGKAKQDITGKHIYCGQLIKKKQDWTY